VGQVFCVMLRKTGAVADPHYASIYLRHPEAPAHHTTLTRNLRGDARGLEGCGPEIAARSRAALSGASAFEARPAGRDRRAPQG